MISNSFPEGAGAPAGTQPIDKKGGYIEYCFGLIVIFLRIK